MIKNLQVVFDNGGGIVIETTNWSHHYDDGEHAANDVIDILYTHGNPLKDGWDGNEYQDGLRASPHYTSSHFCMSEIKEVINLMQVSFNDDGEIDTIEVIYPSGHRINLSSGYSSYCFFRRIYNYLAE